MIKFIRNLRNKYRDAVALQRERHTRRAYYSGLAVGLSVNINESDIDDLIVLSSGTLNNKPWEDVYDRGVRDGMNQTLGANL